MRESLRRLASEEGTEVPTSGERRVRVELMDGDHITVDLDRRARGDELLDRICQSLDVVETDYFGLVHAHRSHPRVWLDLNRRLAKTFKNEPWEVVLSVKFYPPEPSELTDENARYQLALAVRRDLAEGRLTCSAITYALLASYTLQAELGDYDSSWASSPLAHHCLATDTVTDVRDKVEHLYKKHKGQTPAEAELNYLENAKRLPLYGAEQHAATDCDEVDITIAVSAQGIAVYRHTVQMNRFPWAKIIKISYNKRSFTLKLRVSEFDSCETHVSFKLPSTPACKRLWRCCVEQHMFYRREAPVVVDKVYGLLRLGSRRVSCRRTLRQLRDTQTQ